MLFNKNHFKKKHLVIILFFLIILVSIPLSSVQASVDLSYFRAVPRPSFILLEWRTEQELDNLGFNLYRGLTSDFNNAQKLNSSLIPGNTGSTTFTLYDWPDQTVQVGTQYTYWLEDIDVNGATTVHDPVTAQTSTGNTIPTLPSGGGGDSTNTPTPTRTPTRTPTPTTQSTTATPTRTPTRAATATSNGSNPTATTASQSQSTAVSNSVAPTTASQSVTTPIVEEGNSESYPAPTKELEPTSDAETITADSEAGATPQSISQMPEEEEGPESLSAQQIGQGGQNSQQEGTLNTAETGESNRSTIIIMALIISVVLLFVGGGGIILLVLNRTKQPRI